MVSKVCYYYQTFCGLDELVKNPSIVDTIIVSSIHFGDNMYGAPYIHLNDLPPDNKAFDIVWEQTKTLSKCGVEIMLMLGGAGGGYEDLFSNYEVYYGMLKDTIKSYTWITGIDLDIEESVSIPNIKMLIRDINRDFGKDFTITMAPLSSSLMFNESGMGGFIYKDLYNSPEGQCITRFNVQAYGSYSYDTFKAMVDNGYPPEKLVLGMLSGQFNQKTFKQALNEISKIKSAYPNMGGVFDWEYFDAPPNKYPSGWAEAMSEIIKPGIIHSVYNYIQKIFYRKV